MKFTSFSSAWFFQRVPFFDNWEPICLQNQHYTQILHVPKLRRAMLERTCCKHNLLIWLRFGRSISIWKPLHSTSMNTSQGVRGAPPRMLNRITLNGFGNCQRECRMGLKFVLLSRKHRCRNQHGRYFLFIHIKGLQLLQMTPHYWQLSSKVIVRMCLVRIQFICKGDFIRIWIIPIHLGT